MIINISRKSNLKIRVLCCIKDLTILERTNNYSNNCNTVQMIYNPVTSAF